MKTQAIGSFLSSSRSYTFAELARGPNQQGALMNLSEVRIQNYRSIRDLTFTLEDITVLVGENNSGKSNILCALNLLLGETWPSRRSVERSDYYCEDVTQPIHIEARIGRNAYQIERLWCTIPWEERSDTKAVVNGQETYLSNEIRDRCALVYLDANRNLDYHLGLSRWTLFGRVVRYLDDFFRQSTPAPRQQALLTNFEEAQELLRTPLFTQFEEALADNFSQQLRRTLHQIRLNFRAFDPLNYYRAVHPILVEGGREVNPLQAGQGMRNLILLALFRAYARVFRGDAIIAIEEPEIYLHPHAQRSLKALFDDLALQGNQIIYSTHSGTFVDIANFPRIFLVAKSTTPGAQPSTAVTHVSARQLLAQRQLLHPQLGITSQGMTERYRNICTLEHNEAFFAHKILLVEGETEEYSLPIYAAALGSDFDSLGISIVNAHGKGNLDSLFQLYGAFGLPTYVVFDNDRAGEERDHRANLTLLRMLGLPETPVPDPFIGPSCAILEDTFETQMRITLEAEGQPPYEDFRADAVADLGSTAGKGLIARHMAHALVRREYTPGFIRAIVGALTKSHEAAAGGDPIPEPKIPL